MSEASQFRDAFRQEAEELLTTIEECILDIESNPQDSDAVNRLFRAMHTIKGSGAMFGFDDISSFTHHIETTLDRVREGQVSVCQNLIDLILAGRDQIKAMLDDPDSCDLNENARIIAELQTLLPDGTPASASKRSAPATAATANKQIEKTYRIHFEPDSSLFNSGMDPLVLLEELRDLGETHMVLFTDRIPCLDEIHAEQCYLAWDIILRTNRGIDTIRDVFIFVEGDSKIDIREIEEVSFANADEPSPRLGEILLDRSEVPCESLEKALRQQKRLGELLVDSKSVSQEKIKSALLEQDAINKKKADLKSESVRVPSDKLDRLINLVGELVITQAQLSEISSMLSRTELANPVEEIERLTAELRDSVLNIRMMPIGTQFNRFRRLVRDLSKELEKEIDLVTEGADTEMDKTVIEKLADPLVHLIRNSLDHGIETPEVREAQGKNRRGVIRLAAAHKGASVIITIEDDGKGLNPETIRAKAVEKGLIANEAELSEKETFQLIMLPGFSTAAAVTSVSGRGVGMDVVKREIEALRGSVEIFSQPGAGTRIQLSLPLTLAIIDGLLVDVGGERYVIPVSTVEECMELQESCNAMSARRNVLQVRGELVPYVRLRDIFGIPGGPPAIEETVIVNLCDSRLGIVVDRIIGDHQTVIKSLSKVYEDVSEISGATIMGDGSVALILDITGIIETARKEEEYLLA